MNTEHHCVLYRKHTDKSHVKNITQRIPFMFDLIDWGALTDRHTVLQFANRHTHMLTHRRRPTEQCFFFRQNCVLYRGTWLRVRSLQNASCREKTKLHEFEYVRKDGEKKMRKIFWQKLDCGDDLFIMF